jgi:divalent metal cation (Fe/Co/Zn/Cd) transporter
MQEASHSTICTDIVIQKDETGVAVLINCTIPGKMTLAESHEIAEIMKKRIIETLSEVKSVFIHFEPN